MRIDSKLANLLSDFFLAIAKAYFIAAFVTPALSNEPTTQAAILVLTKGLLNAILFLLLAYELVRHR